MSELLAAADQIVPYVASAGVAVITAAQADFAQNVLDRGKRLVRALLQREEGDVPPGNLEQAAALRSLSRPALEELADAIDAWLSAGDLSAGSLRRHVAAVATARVGEHNSGTGHGRYAMGIGKLEGDLTINHGSPDGP
ncbi:hypothetical protein ACH4D5_08200 [Streptomyces sp. NPDC018029]|uniref:hypothetical protein n=1 Tax=Streptomyces sp. NPDC018029 TaxID=3365032 RepID=UPI0037B0BFCF